VRKSRREKTNAKRLKQAADLLRAIAADGWQLYVAGSGNLHMLSGDSHDRAFARGRHDRVKATEHVPTLSGGDW
jgi:uncharacterized phosphosugar-binding protein